MKDKIKDNVDKAKTFWAEQPKKNKIAIGAIAGTVILIAIAVTIFLNLPKPYKTLFAGMSPEETRQVYSILQENGVSAEMDKNGDIQVPEDQWDSLVFELAGKGYPTTAPNYDVFLNNTGFTTTEFEQKNVLLFQLETKIKQTLMTQEGVESAEVSITVPESSNYIWDKNSKEESTAAVTMKMRFGYELSPERVQAIKRLVAFAVPKLNPENVVVVDGATGVEMHGVDSKENTNSFNLKRLEFERAIAKNIEDNVKRLLSPTYGPDGVTAVAQVVIDYDMMKTEQKQYVPEDTGKGIMSHYEEKFSQSGQASAEGLVGEENNTDVPKYSNLTNTGENPVTDYQNSVDYDISYVLTQIERGEPILSKATVGVVVNDSNFDTQKQELLVDLISKSVNIPAENISVTNLNFTAPEAPVAPAPKEITPQTMLIIGAGLLVLIIIIVVAILLSRRAKKRREEETAAVLDEAAQRQLELEKEIEEHKQALQNEAKDSINAKENAIVQEIRDFATQNPELTANLIRTMLKEEK